MSILSNLERTIVFLLASTLDVGEFITVCGCHKLYPLIDLKKNLFVGQFRLDLGGVRTREDTSLLFIKQNLHRVTGRTDCLSFCF